MRLDYVADAYIAFALILGWDYFAPRLKLAQVRRMIALRIRRESAKKNA